jgi:hypothetical protein
VTGQEGYGVGPSCPLPRGKESFSSLFASKIFCQEGSPNLFRAC